MELNLVQQAQVLVVGASQGIGLGFVRHLLTHRSVAQVYAACRSPDTAAELKAISTPPLTESGAASPPRLLPIALDITAEDQIAAAVTSIQQHTDRLHLIVNCVGLLHDGALQPEKSLRQLDAETLMRYFQVNSIGAVLLAKHLQPLLSHAEPSILATISAKIGSIGDNHLGGWYGYRASKAALNMFMRTAAIEYRRKNPHTIVVTLHPGTTDTRLSKPFQRGVPPDKLFSVDRTVTQLMAVLASLTPEDSGAFFSWDGSRLPW